MIEPLEAWTKKLESDHFHILVMGQFKRDKTTLINSLLGMGLLPSSVMPLTSVNILLRSGEEPAAQVHYLDGRKERVSLKRIYELVTKKRARGTEYTCRP
ncbi:dynamin family protein [Candidatus Solincola tengchongensis]|uniref:dynamin family protein n=1 Tax=Candidatus Solincola tengchongensis TaxID=2900693 RepID=UPI00257D78AD|nr:dynamin family protein [Candidatus Solincola tengchongensis]